MSKHESNDYKVVKDGKVLHTGTQTDCDHWAQFNAEHGEVVKADKEQ